MKSKTKPFTILDTTLRDGEQGEGISFTVKDKLKITQLLDQLGMHYIEGGWPGANPKAVNYFEAMQKVTLKTSKLAAFGSTRRAKNSAEDDVTLNALLAADTPVVVIFGKTWDFHATHALKITPEENLKLIQDSVSYLKKHGREVIFDAEHFFDGYKNNPKYALSCLKEAQKSGADILTLCDTNGGCLPSEVFTIVSKVVATFPDSLIGIHTHNDAGMAVANTIAAVEAGAVHIQGTLNGYGERCGNANLSSILPTLMLKMGINCISNEQLKSLSNASHHLDEIANVAPDHFMPYVGKSAFAHKAGVHVSAILKHPETYEHISPEKVGNQQRVVVSELAGVSNLVHKAERLGIKLDSKSDTVRALMDDIKELENTGYQYEEAEASLTLLLRQRVMGVKPKIKLVSFRVIDEKEGSSSLVVEAVIKAKINGQLVHIAAEGNGPVSALDHALQKALIPIFPIVSQVKLVDYKVRVLNSADGTNARVRVLIESEDQNQTWGTIGVSENVIEASWKALVDCYEYKLLEVQD